MNWLGIDFGKRNLGLALARGGEVFPLESFHFQDFNQAAGKILSVAKEYLVEGFVFGLPHNRLGEEVGLAEKIRSFAARFKNRPVHFVDESLTSFSARTAAEFSRLRPEITEHSLAATLILGNFLGKQEAQTNQKEEKLGAGF